MSTLRASVNDYLAMRRAMGFKVEGLGKLLGNFVAFCETHGATRVRNDLAMEWATRTIKVGVSDALVARRMDAVRIFARYQQALGRVHHRRLHPRLCRRHPDLPGGSNEDHHQDPQGRVRDRLPGLPVQAAVHDRRERPHHSAAPPRPAATRAPPTGRRRGLPSHLPPVPAHGRTHDRLAGPRQPQECRYEASPRTTTGSTTESRRSTSAVS